MKNKKLIIIVSTITLAIILGVSIILFLNNNSDNSSKEEKNSNIVLEVKDLEVKVNEEVTASSFIVSCKMEDKECVLTILDKDNKELDKIDTSKEGKYTFTIKATVDEEEVTKDVKLTVKAEETKKEAKKETKATEAKKTESKTSSKSSSKSSSNSNSNNTSNNNNSGSTQPTPTPSQPAPTPAQQNCTRPTDNVIFLSQPCDAERGSSSCYRNDPVYQSQVEKIYHKERKDTEYWYALDRWRQYSVYTDGFQDPMMDSCGRWYGIRISVRLHISECPSNGGCGTTPEYQSCIDTCWTDKSNYDILDSCTNTCNSQYPNHITGKNPYWDSFTKQDGNIIGEYYVTSRGNVWYWNPNGLSF